MRPRATRSWRGQAGFHLEPLEGARSWQPHGITIPVFRGQKACLPPETPKRGEGPSHPRNQHSICKMEQLVVSKAGAKVNSLSRSPQAVVAL